MEGGVEVEARQMKRRGLMLVLSAPSGAGKTTLARVLLQRDPHVVLSVSFTTRPPRMGEVGGVDYTFVTLKEFKEIQSRNGFLEYAKVFDNYYGTPKSSVESTLSSGIDMLFDIDWQGCRQLTSTMKNDVTSVFILPPSKEELVKRVQARETHISDVMKKRLERLNFEISHWHEYDYIIINNSIEETVQKLLTILRAERLKKSKRIGLPYFIDKLMKETLSDNCA